MARQPLAREWTFYTLARRDDNYDSGITARLLVRDACGLWEVWDKGADSLVRLLHSDETVLTAGARLYGIALFAAPAQPQWGCPHSGGSVVRVAPSGRGAAEVLECALECVLFALAEAGPQPCSGVRLLRGRTDEALRIELWCATAQLQDTAAAVTRHLEHAGLPAAVSCGALRAAANS